MSPCINHSDVHRLADLQGLLFCRFNNPARIIQRQHGQFLI